MFQKRYQLSNRAWISAEKAPREMKAHRPRLHPATCFPPNPPEPNTQNRLFIRVASSSTQPSCPLLTFIGINASTYSTIAALLASRLETPIDSIKLFDIGGQREAHATLHDLDVVASLNKTRTRLEWVQSFWQTRGSTIIVIHVQHHRLGEHRWTILDQNTLQLLSSRKWKYIEMDPDQYCADRNCHFSVTSAFARCDLTDLYPAEWTNDLRVMAC